ncbi:hypothetical protein EDB83DRAFT_2406865 [Lactarius deliciosus]|nr:hypothetical protein EDB83DRAFT_2406865 [Lactarius deliciosus]
MLSRGLVCRRTNDLIDLIRNSYAVHSASICLTHTRQCHSRVCARSLCPDSLFLIRITLPMSHAPSTSTSSVPSNFQSIFDAALKAYKKKTKNDLLAHPLAAQLQACNSPADILSILQDKVEELDQSRSADERLSRWLNPTINVLFALSATLGEGIGLVFSPAKVISAGIGVLLSVSILDPCLEAIFTLASVSGGQGC